MSLLDSFKRYRNLRRKGIKVKPALQEFKQPLTKGDAIALTLTPCLIIVALLFATYHSAKQSKVAMHHKMNVAVNNLTQAQVQLFKTERIVVDLLNSDYIRIDGVTAKYGRCNAADGCPADYSHRR